jgi:lysophospholipase L1-like esterase
LSAAATIRARRRVAARLLLPVCSALVTFLLLEAVFRLARVSVGTIQINRATVRASENPRLLYELAPGSFVRAEVDYRVNDQGFRGRSVPLEKPPGTTRVIILGDSIAFGYWVEAGDALPDQLEALLSRSLPGRGRVEVLNFGVPGYNLVQEIETLRTKALEYSPDIVVLAFCLNDLEGPLSYEFGLVRDRRARSMTWSGRLRERLAAQSRLAAWAEYRLAELEARRLFVEELPTSPPGEVTLAEARQRELDGGLREVRALLSRQGAVGVVAVLPLFSEPFDRYRFRPVHEAVVASARRNELAAVDLFDCFSGYDLRDVRVDVVHPSPLGHRVAARALRDALCASALDCIELAAEPSCSGYSAATFARVRGY